MKSDDGKDKKEKPCCCCCVEDLKFKKITPFAPKEMIDIKTKKKTWSVSYGHDMDIEAKLSRKITAKKNEGDCTLTWREKSTSFPEFLLNAGVKENQWNDITELFPTARTFTEWKENQKKPCPGVDTFTFQDSPSMSVDLKKPTKRVLEFEIIVTSSPNCGCATPSITLKAIQTLEHRTGVHKPVQHEFKIIK